MSNLDPDQRAIAEILFGLPAASGYALAGGSALRALGVIDRTTRDVDAFVGARPGASPGDVRPLVAELTGALSGHGWDVIEVRSHETFARLVATRVRTGTEIDLAVDMPPLFPLEVVEGLPVLAAEDLAARKVLAILDRAEGRDFADLAELQRRCGRTSCIEWAMQLDPGVSRSAIATAFTRLDRLADDELPNGDPIGVRRLFEGWSEELRTS